MNVETLAWFGAYSLRIRGELFFAEYFVYFPFSFANELIPNRAPFEAKFRWYYPLRLMIPLYRPIRSESRRRSRLVGLPIPRTYSVFSTRRRRASVSRLARLSDVSR